MTMPSSDVVDATLRRAEALPVLFAERPSRLALQKLPLAEAGALKPLRVNVWRNHAIESLLPLAAPYLQYAGWQAGFALSDYDDSLGFAGHAAADLELVWLDPGHYAQPLESAATQAWLAQRLRTLRELTHAPIVLASWAQSPDGSAALQALADGIPGTYWADLAAVCSAAGVALTDARTAAVAGTPLANAAQALVARTLACHWIAGAVLPPIKAIALDLDQTLHGGILGEDGIDGVQLTPAHAALQTQLRALRARGVFLALVSRNEHADAQALFAQRADYPLRWDDFSAIEVSWDDKIQALARVAQALRIAPDAVLFVDDNPGELAGAAVLPGLHLLHAGTDVAVTARALSFQPGLWRWRVGADDAGRVADLAANAQREALAAHATDGDDYLRSLQLTLTLDVDAVAQRPRAAELCRKTNQFNLSLRRFSEAEIAERMASPDACVATMHMADRLSDSGVIGVLVAARQARTLRVEELCVSCRALGRRMEDTVVLSALAGMPLLDDVDTVSFVLADGPRNQPARDWLQQLLGLDAPPAAGEHALAAATVRAFRANPHVAVRHAGAPNNKTDSHTP